MKQASTFRSLFRARNGVSMMMLNQARYASTNISAAVVKELRERSGAPMMDCKKALMAEGVDGDINKAIDYLRVKGLAKASNNTRTAAEGVIAYLSKANKITLAEVNCETDFVNNNKLFQDFVSTIVVTSNSSQSLGDVEVPKLMEAKSSSHDGKSMMDELGDVVLAIRENIIVRRALNFDLPPGRIVSAYMHGKVLSNDTESLMMGSKLGVVVLDVSGSLSETQARDIEAAGKKLAMHVVAAKPSFVNRESVPADVISKEKAICREQTEATSAGKKAEIIEKMVTGKLAKRLSEICLLDQAHMAEEGNPVIGKYLTSLGNSMKVDVKLNSFYFWHVGQTSSPSSTTTE